MLSYKNIIFVLLVVLAVGGVYGFFYFRSANFSKEILKVEILGPENAKVGQEIEYTVKYKNNGNFTLESPKFIFELPDHSLNEDGKTRFSQNLKDIYPGEENFINFKGVLLGKEGDLRVARVWISYAPKNLSARYESETTLTTKIETVPITLDFDLPSRIEKSKEIEYAINYFSNIDYPLENLSIKIDPVAGFDIKSAEPKSLDNLEWKLSILQKSQGGRIIIRGVVSGQVGSKLVFLAKLGMWRDGSFIVVKEIQKEIEVIQSLLFVSQQVNSFSDYIASPGETLHYDIFFRNIGSTSFDNIFAIYRLDLPFFESLSITSPNGQVKVSDGIIIFDYRQIFNLRHLDPNQETKVSFVAKLKDVWNFSENSKNNIVIKNALDVFDISEKFQTRVNSKLEFSQKVSSSDSSYQITWEIKNYFNDVKNVKVRAVLAQGVTLNDALSPEDEATNFSFDNKSREIVWLAGDLFAGTGVTSAPKTLLFSVSSPSSVSNPIIQAVVSGEDQATGAVIQSTAR